MALKPLMTQLGHAEGDQYLVVIADILKASFRQNDFIARVGGDEFVVILSGGRHPGPGECHDPPAQEY